MTSKPIHTLLPNITERFFNTYPEFLGEVLGDVTLYPNILIINEEKPLNRIKYFACVDYVNAKGKPIQFIEKSSLEPRSIEEEFPMEYGGIFISETFLTYLWCFCYGTIVCFNEIIQKRIYLQQQNDKKELEKAINSFNFAGLLITKYLDWDIATLPNPAKFDSSEDVWVEKVNGLFVEAVNFILLHELGHITNYHLDYEPENSEIAKKDEWEADNTAIDWLLKSEGNYTNDLQEKTGAVLGFIAILFCTDTFGGGSAHPNTDERIENILAKLDADERTWGIANMGILLWAKFVKGIHPDIQIDIHTETQKDFFYRLIDVLK